MQRQWYGRGIQRWWQIAMWTAFGVCVSIPLAALIFTLVN
jgi:hypothetical protein